MNDPIENSLVAVSDNIGVVIVELDGDQLSRGPTDPEKRKALDLSFRRMGETYLAKLRIHRPTEFEAIMKSPNQHQP